MADLDLEGRARGVGWGRVLEGKGAALENNLVKQAISASRRCGPRIFSKLVGGWALQALPAPPLYPSLVPS